MMNLSSLGNGSAPLGAGPDTPAGPGPVSAPLALPGGAPGGALRGQTLVENAIQLLESALPSLGATTPQGKVVITALRALARDFGQSNAQPLIPAQILDMAQAANSGMGGPLGAMAHATPPLPGV